MQNEMVINSLAKYHVTAGHNEKKTYKAEVMPRRGYEPPTFRFTKQAASPGSYIITPQ